MCSLESGFDANSAEAAKAAMEKAIPLGRYGQSADVR